MSSRRLLVAIGLLAVLVATAGCVGGGDGGDSGTNTTATETPVPETATSVEETATPVEETATPVEATPTATPTPTATTTPTATPTATATPTPVEVDDIGLDLAIQNISKCDTLCRDMTYVVNDTAGDGAQDVSADITITSGGEVVYEDQQTLGDISAGGSATQTTRVEAGLSEARTITDNDNQITIEIVLTSDGQTKTITEEREF